MTPKELLNVIPEYVGGINHEAVYKAGQGIYDAALPEENETLIRAVSNTNAEEFLAFTKKLSLLFPECFSHERDGNIYRMYRADGCFIYTYFTENEGICRIIADASSHCTPEEFGYIGGDGETELYQYGLPMNEAGVNIRDNDERKIDCGMMYIIRLADNSLFILDGGDYRQFDDDKRDDLMRFLREITDTPEGEKVRVAGFFISHLHCDHLSGFCLTLAKHHSSILLERVLFNSPSGYSENEILRREIYAQKLLIKYIENYTDKDSVKFIQLHTGEKFNLSSVECEILYTHEDIYDPETGNTLIGRDYNNTTSVLRLEFDSKVFLFLGDINKPSKNVLINRCLGKTLKCDIIQLAHHVINDLSDLYHITKCPIALIPQSPNGCYISEARQSCMLAVCEYARPGDRYNASLGTDGFKVVDGKIKHFYHAKVTGAPYGDWVW